MKGNKNTKGMKRIYHPETKDNKSVSVEELQFYYDQGWKLGSGYAKGSVWVNNGNESKMIQKYQIEDYLENGWLRGRGNFKKRKPRSHYKNQ